MRRLLLDSHIWFWYAIGSDRLPKKLNLPHDDPADRFLAATAMLYELTLVTVDQNLVAADWLPTLTA